MRFVHGQSLIGKVAGCWPVLAALLALEAMAAPAHAGYYNLWPESGSGSVSISTSGGSWGRSLTDTDIQDSVVDGSISYSYTESWRFAWEPESDDTDDLPIACNASISATAQFDFCGVSTEEPQSVSGSGSFSINGTTVSASASYPLGGSPTEVNNYVPQWANHTQALSGWEGTFTVTYSASVAANGPIMAQITIAKGGTSVAPNRYIYIVTPARGTSLPTGMHPNGGPGTADVNITGKWKLPFQTSPDNGSPAQFRVQLLGTYPVFGTSEPNIATSWSVPGPVWRPWEWNREYYSDYGSPRFFDVVAVLEWKQANGQWKSEPQDSVRWFSRTLFSVYDP